jgi:hypothetical protein
LCWTQFIRLLKSRLLPISKNYRLWRYNACSLFSHHSQKIMIKFLHLGFVLLTISLFIGKVALAELKPELLKHKMFIIVPHAISGLLIPELPH